MGLGRFNDYIRGWEIENPENGFEKRLIEQAKNMADQFDTDATVDSEGAVRWTKSQNFPPSDVLEFWNYIHKPFNHKKTLEAKKIHDDKFFSNYFKQQANRQLSDEERFEMTSAFGKGATVVNVLTGQKHKL